MDPLTRDLRKSEERFRLLVESVRDYAIFMLDPEGYITSWNAGAERFKQYREEEVIGRHFSLFYPEEDRARNHPAEVLERATREGQYQEEGWRVRKDGSRFWADITLAAVRDSGGRLVGFAKVTRDLSERRRREVELLESEHRFRAIFQRAGVGIALVSPKGRIVQANPALARMLGYSQGELEGLSIADITHPEDLESDLALVRELLLGKREQYQMEKRYLRKDGAIVWGLLTGSVVEGEADKESYALGMVEDITENKRLGEEKAHLLKREREARGEAERRAHQEAALREAVALVSSAFTVEETTLRIAEGALAATRSDGAFVERLDAERGEVVVAAASGELVPSLGSRAPFQGSFTQRVIEREEPEVVARLCESEESFPAWLRNLCEDCSAAIIPLLDAGEPVGSLVLLRRAKKHLFRPDEVQRAFIFGTLGSLAFRKIHLLEDSERRREELLRVTESRARLMRGFSHDVKNPLGAADGYLSLVEEGIYGELPPQIGENIVRVRRLLGSAVELIENLLDLARTEAGQLEVETAPTDVREAAREMGEEYRAQAEAAGHTLRLELPETLSIILSDPARVRQVVSNLLSNAIKYTPAGGSIRVVVQERESEREGEHGWVCVDVEDDGPGIPKEQQSLLFQEFARLDPGTIKGSGIGLAISQKIAQALGGRVSVKSESGRGSIFTLWLPLQRVGERRALERA